MDKYQKIIKRQRARLIEPHTNSVPTSESYEAGADERVWLAQPADLEQPIQSVESHLSADSWSAIDRKPLPYYSTVYYPAVSHWLDELREIRQECDLDVWESCPYD